MSQISTKRYSETDKIRRALRTNFPDLFENGKANGAGKTASDSHSYRTLGTDPCGDVKYHAFVFDFAKAVTGKGWSFTGAEGDKAPETTAEFLVAVNDEKILLTSAFLASVEHVVRLQHTLVHKRTYTHTHSPYLFFSFFFPIVFQRVLVSSGRILLEGRRFEDLDRGCKEGDDYEPRERSQGHLSPRERHAPGQRLRGGGGAGGKRSIEGHACFLMCANDCRR